MAERSTMVVQLVIGRVTEDEEGNLKVEESQKHPPVFDFDNPTTVFQETLGLLVKNLSYLDISVESETLQPVREFLQKIKRTPEERQVLHERVNLCPSCGEPVGEDEEYCYSCSYYYEGR